MWSHLFCVHVRFTVCLSRILPNKDLSSDIKIVFEIRECNTGTISVSINATLCISSAAPTLTLIWLGLVHDLVHRFLYTFVPQHASFISPHFLLLMNPTDLSHSHVPSSSVAYQSLNLHNSPVHISFHPWPHTYSPC
jgi:hypothetical protein